jgi:hypothetical protein
VTFRDEEKKGQNKRGFVLVKRQRVREETVGSIQTESETILRDQAGQ